MNHLSINIGNERELEGEEEKDEEEDERNRKSRNIISHLMIMIKIHEL